MSRVVVTVRILLDQGVLVGKQFWKKDIMRWHEEVNKAFLLDINLMKLVFHLLEILEDEVG